MVDLNDDLGFVPVTRIEATTVALGGDEVNSPNSQFKELASRDRYLFDQIDLGDATAQNNFTQLKTLGLASVAQGRITPITNTPRPDVESSNVTSLFYTPDGGDQITVYNDAESRWDVLTFTETAIALGALPGSTMYDIFAFNDGGSLGIDLVQWANSQSATSARATPLTRLNGVLVNSANNRKYLGTFRTQAPGETTNTFADSLIWNNYNRIPKAKKRQLLGVGAYTVATPGWSALNGDPSVRLRFVSGQPQSTVIDAGVVKRQAFITPAANIGLNSSTVRAADIWSNGAGVSKELVVAQLATNLFGFNNVFPLQWGGTEDIGSGPEPLEYQGDFASVGAGTSENDGISGIIALWEW